MSAQRELDQIRQAHKTSEDKIINLELKRSSAVVVGFTLQQISSVCAVVAVVLGRKGHGMHVHHSHHSSEIS